MTIAFIIAVVSALVFLCTVYKQDKLIKRLKKEYSEEKDNTVNYYEGIIQGFRNKVREEEEKYDIISALYCASESDSIKYNSEKAMERAIRSKLAMRIGNVIAKRFEPNSLPLGDGKKKYHLTVKVKKI